MASRLLFIVCSLAILLLMVSSSAINPDDQYYPRARKVSNGAWLSAHQFQPMGKRGRFVFRDAPTADQHDELSNDDLLLADDGQGFNGHLNKRNWRL